MKRTKAQAQETREQLLLAALDVFDRRGVARTSLQEIAQEAGLTRGALYWHFKNKEDLFDALFLRIFHDVSQRLDDDIRNNAPDMLASLRQALVNMFERLQHNALHRKFSHILHLKCEHTQENAGIVDIMNRYHLMWQEQTESALRLCVRQGALPSDLDLAFATTWLKSAVVGLLQLWLVKPERMDLSATAPRVIDVALGALQNDPLLRAGAQSSNP